MRKGIRYLALGGVSVLIAAAPVAAEKIKVKWQYDRSKDFARYKRYTMGPNYLVTHQRPEVQACINQVLVESLKRQLQAKGFILDDKHPNFVITYEAGSLAKADTSAPPDIYYGVPTDSPAFGQIGLEGIPAEVWTYALAKLKLTVTDVGSGKPVWTARASEKIPYPKNALRDLRTRVDDLMAETLKSFPPAGTKQPSSRESGLAHQAKVEFLEARAIAKKTEARGRPSSPVPRSLSCLSLGSKRVAVSLAGCSVAEGS